MHDFQNEINFVKGKKRSSYEAWVDPKGNWYNMYHLGGHNGFAYRAYDFLHPLPEPEAFSKEYFHRVDHGNECLLKDGWIMVIGWSGPVVLRGYEHMTRGQFKALHAVLGETRLFRGWTVRGLLLVKDEAKEQAKDDY